MKYICSIYHLDAKGVPVLDTPAITHEIEAKDWEDARRKTPAQKYIENICKITWELAADQAPGSVV